MLKKLFTLALLLPAICYAEIPIPEAIQPPEGSKPVLTTHAKGWQIYSCAVNTGQYQWQLNAPDARLFDDKGQVVGKHYSGPIWEYKKGSQVTGKVLKKIPASSSSATAWLLVEVIEHKGSGLLAGVSYINRINTQGGLPPDATCDGNFLGSEKRVPYTADYIFYAH